ncbi:MAG: TetR/AcrR family transcriptional regulator [Oscillospiraceae bacterium]|nr:TetR/AcrR family transcriptional regulator [Oscillospiraceae bacterium]
MDRRQRKTREAIFSALIELLSQKDFGKITVGEIIEKADVGRATFYAHFETKEFLLKELCEDLFCHVFDALREPEGEHHHLFQCDPPDSVFLHLFSHLMRNDNHILKLLSCNHDLFLRYFTEQLKEIVQSQLPMFENRKSEKLPEEFWIDHIASVFIQTLRFWLETGRKESPETLTEYFYLAV